MYYISFPRGRSDELDSIDKETLIEQLEAYQQAIQEWREEFEKSQKVCCLYHVFHLITFRMVVVLLL